MFLRVREMEVRFCMVSLLMTPNLGVRAAENQKLEIRNWKLAALISSFQFPVSNFQFLVSLTAPQKAFQIVEKGL